MRLMLATLLTVCLAAPAAAQSRPLVTEDPETVPAGFLLLEGGIDYLRGVEYPASGLGGNLFRAGTFGVSIGISTIAELQFDGGLRSRLAIRDRDVTAPLAGQVTAIGDTSSTLEDLLIGAKVRFVSETDARPAIALRFATRVPAASDESGIGTGTFDFTIGLAAAKTVQSIRVATNFGIAMLGSPVAGHERNQAFAYGLSVARAVAPGVELVGEFNGRADVGEGTPPPGTESRAAGRFGGRITRGPIRLDAAVVVGATDRDPSLGVTAGFTWVFKGFEVK
jgi:hypothetical protein